MKIQQLTILLFVFGLLACQTKKKVGPKVDVIAAVTAFPTDSTVQVIATLPSVVDESSGIINWQGHIWTHNDSKNQPALFEVAPTSGQLLQTLTIANVDNLDWEEIAQDEAYIYIGDFGNNHGTRKNLMIFKVAKEEIRSTQKVSSVDTIQFAYPDQLSFDGPTHGHDYDCEAMIAVGDSLYLFTKNFKDQQTRLYSLPKTPGMHAAQLKERFDTKGTITGAGINRTDGTVALAGYVFDNGSFLPFVWLLWDYPNQSFLSGKQQRINLPFMAQVEGVCHDQGDHFYISSESTLFTKGQLYRLDAGKWKR